MKNLGRSKILIYSSFFLTFICFQETYSSGLSPGLILNDTVDVQLLYNGRAWRNLYYIIKGDQFLFSPDFLYGSVTVQGKTFNNLRLKYDIYNDEIITITNRGIIIQLNKEMVDFFTLNYNSQVYKFKRLETDSLNSLTGFVNVLYSGGTSLIIKYRKEILLLAVENRYDLFNQVNRIYVEKNGIISRTDNKRGLFNLLEDQKRQVRNFVRSNRIKISKKDPESFRPVIEYYDKLQQ